MKTIMIILACLLAAMPALQASTKAETKAQEKRNAEVQDGILKKKPEEAWKDLPRPRNGIYIVNTHNLSWGGRGAKVLRVAYYLDNQLVEEQGDIKIAWAADDYPAVEVEFPDDKAFNLVRVDIVEPFSQGAGLAEIEIWVDGSNVAPRARISGSKYPRPGLCEIENLIDGKVDFGDGAGYWLTGEKPAYVELKLRREVKVKAEPKLMVPPPPPPAPVDAPKAHSGKGRLP